MKALLLTTAALVPLATVPAWAQAAPAAAAAADETQVGLEDIIVTAQRRNENLQQVPIAVTVTNAAHLAAFGVADAVDVAQVTPGLQMSVSVGFLRPHLRGVGTDSNGPGIENPIAIYLDGVYLASSSSSLLSLGNIDRIEVLKGPQGTLFGRNATGGLLQVVTKTPSQNAGGNLTVGYGNYNTKSVDGYLTGGFAESLAADLAIHYVAQGDGYGRNLATGRDVMRDQHDLALRSKIFWEPGSDTSVTIAGDYSYRKSSALTFLAPTRGAEAYAFYNNVFTASGPYAFPNDFYDLDQDAEPAGEMNAWGVSLNIDQRIDGVALKSITAYRQTRFQFSFDLDATRDPLFAFDPGTRAVWNQFSQELQLSSDGSGPLKWTAGLYYFASSDGYDPLRVNFGPVLTLPFFGIPANQIATVANDRQRTRSYAGYGQASWEFLPDTRLTLGGRYTHERKSLSGTSSFLIDGFPVATNPVPPPTVEPKSSFSNFSYRVALDHSFTDRVLGYVSYNTGFKSGGYNPNVPEQDPYRPEKIRAIEAGLKTELMDRRLRLNVAAFHYRYSNIQVARYIQTSLAIYNGAQAKLYGLDLDIEAVLAPSFSLTGGLSYLHNRFTRFPDADYSYFQAGRNCVANPPGSSALFTCDAAGNNLAYAAKFTANIGGNWSTSFAGGTLGITANLYHSGSFFGSVDNNPLARQRAYEQLNASISWSDASDKLKLTLWGKNLLDQQIASTRLVSPQGILYNPLPPLTFGGTATVRF